jgi:hypothetical protein
LLNLPFPLIQVALLGIKISFSIFKSSKVDFKKRFLINEIDYISKVAKTEKKICSLIEAGFEYVTEFEGSKSLENANFSSESRSIATGGTPRIYLCMVQGVGFEPTNAYAIGS